MWVYVNLSLPLPSPFKTSWRQVQRLEERDASHAVAVDYVAWMCEYCEEDEEPHLNTCLDSLMVTESCALGALFSHRTYLASALSNIAPGCRRSCLPRM